ncbi:acetyl-CoA carboxylase biotin carboxyl carrier protein [Amycolatopsis sp. SB7-3]|uniref:acetyl-CoA carboxylase biotin carboxyl carrier protein n=1 Tax=Amycolatopsis sp. SB7-3 TaxID=3373438 RepID=UPI0037429F6E
MIERHPEFTANRDLSDVLGLETEILKLGAEDAMEILCRGLAEVVTTIERVPTRATVRLGSASIDVEWLAAEGSRAPAAPEPVTSVPSVAPAETPVIRTPVVGTCYLAPEPGAKPFVSVGDVVEPGRQVAIVEAMKLMNPIVADRAGRVARILVADAEPVEYDQALIAIEPEKPE